MRGSQSQKKAAIPAELTPVFVFGALRSGTTMFRLMLNNHGQVSNPGEADFLFDFLTPDPSHPTGWRYDLEAMQNHRIFKARGLVIPDGCDGLDLLYDMIRQFQDASDKVLTLNMHRNIERMVALLPQARFIHILRDPRDVARSSIGMGWAGNSYYGVDHWISTERGWDAAAASIPADQLLTIKFETLMADLEPQLKNLCDFLAVDYSETMLLYHQNTSYGPPDPKISQQWRRKATAREIALLEGKCADLLVGRGYDLAGAPILPGAIERLYLAGQNRGLRWRHNIRRFGLPLFLSAHFTSLFGPKSLNERLQRQIEGKLIKGLK